MTSALHVVIAAVLVVLAASAAPAANAQRLGRVFTTPEQRRALDEIRAQAEFAQPDVQAEQAREAVPIAAAAQQPSGPAISSLTINGVVRRSGGKTMVWVNGHEVEHGKLTRDGVLVESAQRSSGDVRLRLPSGTESIALRPGQKIDVGSGLVLEPYEKDAGSPTSRSAFDIQEQPSKSESSAGDAQKTTSAPAQPQSRDAKLTTASQQSAVSGAKVLDIVERLRTIANLPSKEQAAALSELSAGNAPSAVPSQPRRP
jgi:hypothetical protein